MRARGTRTALFLQMVAFVGCGVAPDGVDPNSIGQSTLALEETMQVCGSCPTGYTKIGQWYCGPPWAKECRSDEDCAICKCSSAATCPPTRPTCDSRSGTHGALPIVVSAIGQYRYHDVWCTPNKPDKCMAGYYVKTSLLATQSCVTGVPDCTAPDAAWNVSCNWAVDCVYDCAGVCVLVTCP